jgi:LysM repeat protein
MSKNSKDKKQKGPKEGSPEWYAKQAKGKASHNYRYDDPTYNQFKKVFKKDPANKGKPVPGKKEYYKKEYPKLLKTMVDNYKAQYPGAKITKTKDGGYKIKSPTGMNYELANPSKKGSKWRQERSGTRNLEMLDDALNNRKYDENQFRVDRGSYKVRTGGGGNDIFSQAGKALSGAVSSIGRSVSNPMDTFKKLTKPVGQIANQAISAGKDLTKGVAKAGTGVSSNLIAGAGSATGIQPLKQLGTNLNRETQSGIDKYGDAAFDIGANVATTGMYGLAKQGAGALESGNLSSLTKPEMLANVAASQLGVDPTMLQYAKAGMDFANDPNKALLNTAAEYSGVDSDYLQAGLNVAEGKDISKIGTNLLADKTNVDPVVSGLIKGENPDKLARGIAGKLGGDNMAYTIKKGDNLEKLAAQHGVTVDQIMAANPNIKDKNRILAGATLNIPGQDTQQPAQAQPAQQNQVQDTRGNALKKQTSTESVKDDRNWLQQFGDSILDNRELTGTAVGVGGAYLGYKKGQEGYDEYISDLKGQQKYIRDQLKPTITSPELLKYEDDAKVKAAQEQTFDFYKQRMEMGETPQERAQRLKAREEQSQFAQGQRQAGLEQQARTAGGAATGGNALAASLMGAQGASNRLAQDEREIQAQAFANKEQAAGRMGDLARNRLQDEFSRAQGMSQEQSQYQKDLFNQKYTQGTNVQNLMSQRDLAKYDKTGAEAKFITDATGTINTGIQAAGQRRDDQAALQKTKGPPKVQGNWNRVKQNQQQKQTPPPAQQPPAQQPPAQQAQPKPPAQQQSAGQYSVQKGDNLTTIAQRYGMTTDQLYEKNKDVIGTDKNLIKPGQTFKL